MTKIVIRTPNWLGDSVMAIPVVQGIRRLFPAAELTVLTKPGLTGLWRLVPEIDEVITYQGINWSFIRELKKYRFEQAFILPNSWESALGPALAGIPRRTGYRRNGRQWLLTNTVPLPVGWQELHQIDYFTGILADSADRGKGAIPRVSVDDALREQAKEFLLARGWREGAGLIGVHATASYGPAKCWLPRRFSQLLEQVQAEDQSWFFVCGSAREKPQVAEIINNISARERIINLAGETDLGLLAGIISLAKVFIANDSGPMHLAASLGVPVTAIFGSTDSRRTGPRGQAVVVKKDLSCSPCLERRCRGSLECMRQVTVNDVLSALKTLLAQDELRSFRSWKDWRVALVMKDYDLVKGGAERYLVSVAQRMAKRGIAVDLIVNGVNGDPPAGVTLRQVRAIRRSSVLMPLSFNRAVQKLLGKRKYDLVYGLTQIYPQDVFRLGGGLEHSWFSIRYPKFWQQLINVIRPKVAVRLWVENKIFSPGNYKKIITNSRLCKNQLLSRYPIDPAAVTVAYNGIDRTNFSHHVRGQYRQQVREELKIPLTAKVILFVSHNWKRKGLRELIVALGRLKKDSLWLLVVGRGRPKRWRRLIAGQGLAKRVIFIGTTTTPWRYYGAADLFVLPTYYDPCANVCLEALACGLPVVTTKMNGASELICAGKNGYIVTRPQAVVELAEYINELLFCRDSELLAREALRAVKDLTLEKNVDMTIVALAEAGENQSAVNGVLAGNGYRSWLADKGWLAADKVMAFSGGQLLKKNKLRSVVRFEDKGKVYYLKRHFSRRGGVWARREWQNIFRLRSLGINTMTPVAVGWEPDGRQAYFITEALEDAERLEDFIPRYFKPPLSAEKSGQKRVLIRQLARLTKWLHDNCLFHKDFYSGHIFVRASGEGERFTLFLIDLQRVAEHRLLRGHWQVKDLTSLNFSCPFAAISDSDRIRFLRCYLGGNNFTGRRRQLLGRINRKTKKIAGHTEKMLARRKQCQM